VCFVHWFDWVIILKRLEMQYFVCFLFPGSEETDNGWGGKLNSHLMASCIRNIRTKTYYSRITLLQLMMKKNFGVCFYASQCRVHKPFCIDSRYNMTHCYVVFLQHMMGNFVLSLQPIIVHLFIHSFVSLIHLFIYSLFYSLINSLIHLLVYSFIL